MGHTGWTAGSWATGGCWRAGLWVRVREGGARIRASTPIARAGQKKGQAAKRQRIIFVREPDKIL